MSDLLNDEDLRTEREPVKEPSKRWRNWWRAKQSFRQTDGSRIPEGHIGAQIGVFPSKEIAEQRAVDYEAACLAIYGKCCSEYIGAYPEGERP